MSILWNVLKFKTKLLNSYYKKNYKKTNFNYLNWAKVLNELFYLEQFEKRDKSPIQKIIDNQKKIDTVFSLLCDEKSKQNYQQELAYKIVRSLTNNPYFANFQTQGISRKEFEEKCKLALQDNSMPKINTSNENLLSFGLATTFYYHQYEYNISSNQKIGIQKNDTVLDCGAAYGDSAYWAYKNGAKKIYCFEVTPDTLSILKETIINNELTSVAEIIPQALGKTSGEAYFSTFENAYSNCIASKKEENCIVVPVTTIDIFCSEHNVKPTFIKMDIEGAELDALEGAKETIRNNRPRLAISIYHKLEHMWEIPLLIHKIEPHYKFYCKKNGPDCDFILYAICE